MKLKIKRKIDFILGNFLAFSNLILAKLLGFIFKRNHTIDKEPSNIIFIKMLGLGSVFLASDAILSIKQRYPKAKLIFITRNEIKAGIEPLKLFDEIWELNDNNFLVLVKDSLFTLFKIWKLKKKWTVDLEVYSKLTTVFSLWTCSINRFGFILNTVRFRANINTHNVYFNQFLNVEENYIRLANAMGVKVKENFNIESYSLSGRGEEINYPFIAINNTCSDLSLERKCPENTLSEICKWILENTHYQLVFTGTAFDKEKIFDFIHTQFTMDNLCRIKNIAGEFTFEEYYDFLYHQCTAMITIDSAPLHIAKKLNVPTLSLWGPTHPNNLTKENDRNLIYYLSKECSPCLHHTETLPCKGDNICMKHMKTENIIILFKKLLENIQKK